MKQYSFGNTSRPKVLVAEDDSDDMEILSEAFSEKAPGHNVIFVEDGIKLVQHLEKCPDTDLPCLIVLDYNLPMLTGLEVLQHLSNVERIKNIPRVVYSTSANSEYIQKCMHAGAVAYIKKSASMNGIFSDIQHMLRYCS